MKSEPLIMDPIESPLNLDQAMLDGRNGFEELIAGLAVIILIVALIGVGKIVFKPGKQSLLEVLRSLFPGQGV